jgi:hypothetical protein
MGNDDPGERLAVLETEMRHIKQKTDKREAREWALIMAIFGLLLTLFAQNLGWFK